MTESMPDDIGLCDLCGSDDGPRFPMRVDGCSAWACPTCRAPFPDNPPPLDLDLLYDEAFPHDPFLSGVLRAEMERMGYGTATPTAPLPDQPHYPPTSVDLPNWDSLVAYALNERASDDFIGKALRSRLNRWRWDQIHPHRDGGKR